MVINFHVAHAGVIDGAWRATKLVGTLTQSNPSELGCVSSHATMQIIGTLLT
jgi:hypothetical protein